MRTRVKAAASPRKHSHPANRDWKESKQRGRHAPISGLLPIGAATARPGRDARTPVSPAGCDRRRDGRATTPKRRLSRRDGLGVANLSDDIVLGDWPRLSTTWDELLAKMPRSTPQGAYGIRMALPQRRTIAGAAYICAGWHTPGIGSCKRRHGGGLKDRKLTAEGSKTASESQL